jgi:hypothetical protein
VSFLLLLFLFFLFIFLLFFLTIHISTFFFSYFFISFGATINTWLLVQLHAEHFPGFGCSERETRSISKEYSRSDLPLSPIYFSNSLPTYYFLTPIYGFILLVSRPFYYTSFYFIVLFSNYILFYSAYIPTK